MGVKEEAYRNCSPLYGELRQSGVERHRNQVCCVRGGGAGEGNRYRVFKNNEGLLGHGEQTAAAYEQDSVGLDCEEGVDAEGGVGAPGARGAAGEVRREVKREEGGAVSPSLVRSSGDTTVWRNRLPEGQLRGAGNSQCLFKVHWLGGLGT